MPLDPQAQALLDQMKAFGFPDFHSMSAPELRQLLKNTAMPVELAPLASVENRQIPGPASDIPIRIYTPQGNGPFPVLVFFHGGGWTIGDLDGYDEMCSNLAHDASCLVVSVEYRLAPENKFPAAPEDCYAATVWVAANAASFNGDASRIAVGGDSAGGNLTAVITHMARDLGGPPLVFQLMIYPGTDFVTETASMKENGEGYLLSTADIEWFTAQYLNNEEDKKHPMASPNLTADLHGLLPAMVVTAEYDPLRDQGKLYADRLSEAGVPVTYICYPGMFHGFAGMAKFLDQAKKAMSDMAEALRNAFSLSSVT